MKYGYARVYALPDAVKSAWCLSVEISKD